MKLRRSVLGVVAPLAIAGAATPASAQSLADVARQVRAMRDELAAQRALIDDQARLIARQQDQIERLRAPRVADAAVPAPGRVPAPTATDAPLPAAPVALAAPLPAAPVGDPTGIARIEQVDAVLEGRGVLTPPGRFVLEPSVQYTNSATNRLVFRGVELVPGIQIGLIDASNADRDTVVTTGTVRYGLTGNLEVEARVPFLFRSDRIATVQQQQDATMRQARLTKNGLGDIEVGLRYQLNHPVGQRPILIAGFRVKTDTGVSPFSVAYDSSGVAEGLATGSGFWAVQPSLNVLLPSDPVVLFGGLSYLYQIPRSIDRTIGDVQVGRVDPGGAIGGNLGFGFALNPRFSFSLGYEHTYIFPTRSIIGGAANRSDRLQIGSFAMGMAYRLTERRSLNFGLEVGATRAAPDVSAIVRMPLTTN